MKCVKKVTFLNHASVLIQDNKSFILTDPWYNKAAFGSWLPTPPNIYNPVYLLSLARSSENFYIGYQGSVMVEPNININPLIRWLSMFGYVYQNRIVSDYR